MTIFINVFICGLHKKYTRLILYTILRVFSLGIEIIVYTRIERERANMHCQGIACTRSWTNFSQEILKGEVSLYH